MRRLVIAISRAVALLILVAGLSGALAIALPNVQPIIRYASALFLGVALFETLRPWARRPAAVVAPADVPAATSDELIDAQRTIDQLRSEAERNRVDAQKRADSLTHDVQDLLEINAGLRQQVDKGTSELAEARTKAAEREKRLREQFEAENTHVQRAAGKALDEIQKTRTVNDELRAQVDREKQNAATLQKTAEALQTEREKLQSQIAEFQKRMASASQEMDGLRAEQKRARREVEEARQKAEVDKASLRTAIENEWTAKMQQMSAVHAKQRDEGQNESRNVTARVAELQQQLDEARRNAQQLLTAGQDLTQQLDEERRRFQNDLHETLERERQNFREQFEPATRKLQEAQQELENERKQSGALRSELASRPVVDEKALRDHIAVEWETKLQKMVNELTADHEHAIGEAIEAREAARAEVRAMTMKMQSLQDQLQSARDGRLGLLQRDDQLSRELEHERKERERLEAELATLRSQPVVDEKALRYKIEAEFGHKLQTIVGHMATDHEADVGKAIEEREAARAELRNLTGKLSAMQQKLAGEKREVPAVDEKALRDKIEAEWSEKLQTIVNHIASDHESDIGKAIEEREAARAEARNLAIKMKALEQKLEGERQSRETLAEKLRAANEEIVGLRSVPAPLPPSAMPTEPMQAFQLEDEQQARADVLQFAEQANAVLRRITSPGTAPVPQDERKKVRILFVHHDPALRTLWRDNLARNGFEVQTAVDGLEGLRIAMADKPDVVIADASMPKMDGRELCQLIKSNQETASVKVILMTGIYTTEAPAETATPEFEADEMLRKPVKFDAMKNALTSLLAARV
ncbi:MAG: response regulator [Acidobacteriota bacterium]|nr:response regulator [Acidobacteriota bacterium]